MYRCLSEKSNENALCVQSTPLPSPSGSQPNDLWRFFPGEDEGRKPEHLPFVEKMLRTDAEASSRLKEVLGVMELYESATASWGETPVQSRTWFQPPETSFEVAKAMERSPSKDPQSFLRKPPKNKLSMRDVPSWRVQSAAVYFTKPSKEALLQRCPPKLSKPSADHVSLLHDPNAEALMRLTLGKHVKMTAYGETCGVVSQQVLVKLPDGLTTKSRPHVTVSFAERVLKRDIAAMKGNGSYDKWLFPLQLEGIVGFKMDNGTVIFTPEEFYVETGTDLRDVDVPCLETKSDYPKEDTSIESSVAEMEDSPTSARPSDQIRRLVAHASFSSRREESTPRTGDKDSPRLESEHLLECLGSIGSRRLEKSKSATEARGMIRLPEGMTLGCRVLNNTKGSTSFMTRHPVSPMKSTDGPSLKAKQAQLRAECEDHRQASWKEQRRGDRFLAKARSAYLDGQREVGDRYSKVSQEATLKQREHTTKAEQLAFEASNLGRMNTHEIDLHHLHLSEAISRLKKNINGLKSFVDKIGTSYRLKIITGKGNNSVDNIPVLRPAVLEYLKTDGMEAEVDGRNDGVVIAYIRAKEQ